MHKQKISVLERLISAISYITMGWGGMIYAAYVSIRKKTMTPFVKFNILQSIFISLLYFCIAMAIGLLLTFLSYIPVIKYLASQITYLLNKDVLFNYSFIQIFVFGSILYLSLISLFGKYPRVYWVSDIISKQAK